MSLQQQLSELKADIKTKFDAAIFDRFEKSIDDLRQAGAGNNAPKTGDNISNFVLTNQSGQQRSLTELRANGPVVMVFYRGGWCPYCNMQLHAYQQILPQLKEAGATLVAITPETPDNSLSTSEKHGLEFEVLTDTGAAYAKEIGIAFSLPQDLQELYTSLGGDLNKFNGEGNWNLPIPATFVVDTDGKVAFAHVDANYTTRANTEDVLQTIASLNQVHV